MRDVSAIVASIAVGPDIVEMCCDIALVDMCLESILREINEALNDGQSHANIMRQHLPRLRGCFKQLGEIVDQAERLDLAKCTTTLEN